MASTHFAMKSSSSAPSSAKHSDYITREQEYSRRKDLELSESGNMPDFATQDPRAFWLAADANERVNGRTYTEIQVALPRELSREGQIALAREAAQQFMGGRHAYTMAIHTPLAKDKIEQPHMHLMFSERAIDDRTRKLEADQFFKRNGAKKDRDWNDKSRPEILRGVWCDMVNRALQREGVAVRVDPRSWAEQGREDLAALVEPKLSAMASPEQLREVEQLRELRKELPPAHLTGPEVNATLEREAAAKIAAIEGQKDREVGRLERMIAQVKEAMRQIAERVRGVFNPAKAQPAEAAFEHKKETQERAIDPAKARQVEAFLSAHKRDFSDAWGARSWFDQRLEQLSTLKNPATGRGLFADSLYENGRTVAQSREELGREVANLESNKNRIERMVQDHKDPRSFMQKVLGTQDERLAGLLQAHGKAVSDLANAQHGLQQIEARWTQQSAFWEQKAAIQNAQGMAGQEQIAQGLRDIRPDILREVERQDSDPVRQKALVDERYVDMLKSELEAGTDPEQLKQVQLKWQLGNHATAEVYFDSMLERAQNKITAERQALNREFGLIQQNTPKIDYPSR